LQATVSFLAETPLNYPATITVLHAAFDRSFAMLPVPIIIVRFVMIS